MKKSVIYTLSLVLIFIITLGFYGINNSDQFLLTKVDKHAEFPMQNFKIKESTNDDNVQIIQDKQGVAYNVNLEKPGDFYEFTVDIVNNSNKLAVIDNVEIATLTNEQKKYLDYKVTYLNNEDIKVNDKVEAHSKKTLKITIYFKEDITVEDLPTSDEKLDLDLNINLIEAD